MLGALAVMDTGLGCDPHSRHIVLVVGDVCDTDRTILTTTLLDAGFDAIAVESGAATLKLLAGGVQPCVVVIDVDLPDMEGRQLWQRLHELDALTRPAAVLALGAEPGGTPAGVVPIRPLLRKPAAIDQLIAIIERHCPIRAARAVL
jgi:CheY-like chemotaxis protein